MKKKDLENEVTRLNAKYCKRTNCKLAIGQAYGGYRVDLVSKCDKKGNFLNSKIKSGAVDMTPGYQSATQTINALQKSDSRGWLKGSIDHYESKKVARKK